MNTTNLHEIIDSFKDRSVLVIGEAMLDSYLQGTSDRLCREAPVPVVNITGRVYEAGGAANTAVNIASLGGKVSFLSVVGDDPEGELLRQTLEEAGVPMGDIHVSINRQTLAKQRVLAGPQMVVRFDQGSTEELDPLEEQKLINRLIDLFYECDALVISDYDYGILTPRVIQAITWLQETNPKLVIADSKRLPVFRNAHVTAVKPNYKEAVAMLGLETVEGTNARVIQIAAHGEEILDLTGAQIAAVTIDAEGALVFQRDSLPYRTYSHPAPDSKAAGAGDTYIATLALSLAAETPVETAVELASAAAMVVVSKDGTSACYLEELHSFFASDQKVLPDAFETAARMAAYRREGKLIVFTNGVFDIIHSGHISYLNQAKALGDVLVVGLNSDESVKRLKGPERPINNQEDRASVLGAMSCVDHIIPFTEDTPHEVIRLVKPDIFVKGGDYTRKSLPEAPLVEELGGVVRILPYLQDRSTTGTIEKIKAQVTGDR